MSAAPTPVVLAVADVSVDVFAANGGRIGQITVDGQPLLIDVPTPLPIDGPMQWGSFPMAPWAGRIREGSFSFDGVRHQLAVNHHDGPIGDAGRTHSIHGTTFTRPWSVDDVGPAALTMSIQLQGALDWPFVGTATQRIELSATSVTCMLTLETTDGSFPGEVGWHPWFRKPDRLDFRPATMYLRDDFGIPTGELITPTPPPWDDCFVSTEPVVLGYDRPAATTVTVSSDCDHWVVFDHMDHATCVEPQSGPPDSFNGVGGGPHLIAPDRPLTRSVTIAW